MICTLTLCKETNCGKFISVYQHLYRDMYLYYNINKTNGRNQYIVLNQKTLKHEQKMTTGIRYSPLSKNNWEPIMIRYLTLLVIAGVSFNGFLPFFAMYG